MYARKRKNGNKKQIMISNVTSDCSDSSTDISISEAYEYSDVDDDVHLTKENGSTPSKQRELSAEYLENELDVFQSVDDWDGIHYYYHKISCPVMHFIGWLSLCTLMTR